MEIGSEVKCLTQDCTAGESQRQDWNAHLCTFYTLIAASCHVENPKSNWKRFKNGSSNGAIL